jgi:hypothetical protein
MRRERQHVDDLLGALSPLESTWKDAHSDAVLQLIEAIPQKATYDVADLKALLDRDFDATMTAIRLVLELSKDEFTVAMRATLPAGTGVKRFREDDGAFIGALVKLGVLDQLGRLANTPITWRNILLERLKAGRGSAIKGQARGRGLEDFVELLVRGVFGAGQYSVRSRFVGSRGTSTEKADFAIPSKNDARILIETKAYGATGSKQTDVLGDVARIVEQKRHDTDFLLVTDGVTWRDRVNDLRKLVTMQNEGLITRIYTRSMAAQLEDDLKELKRDHAL